MMKELVIEVTSSLPDNATLEDIINAICIRLQIEEGLDAVENGEVLTEQEVLKEIKGWK